MSEPARIQRGWVIPAHDRRPAQAISPVAGVGSLRVAPSPARPGEDAPKRKRRR